MRKLYKILGLPLGSNKPTIKKAYRKLAQKHHPDHGGSEELFKHITVAYEILSGKREPSRHERTQYGDPESSKKKVEVCEPKQTQPPPKPKITAWPPPHLQEHWKQQSRRGPSPKQTLRRMVVHDPTFYKKMTQERRCVVCNGTGKSKLCCKECDGTGNIVVTHTVPPASIRRCIYCDGKGIQYMGVCTSCRGQGR